MIMCATTDLYEYPVEVTALLWWSPNKAKLVVDSSQNASIVRLQLRSFPNC